MDTRKKNPKWEFGRAPISVTMQGRYNYTVQSMIDFLEGNATIEEIEPDKISELKGMFNRCLRKDQWDWLSVFARFGSPKRESLTPLIPLLIDLRRSVISGETQIVGSISQRLLQLDLLRLLRTFQDASYSQSNNTESLTREEATRRIGEAAEEKLTELDLSGLSLKELPPEIVKCTHLTRLDLSDNRITSIPDALGQLLNLTQLQLGYNKITSIPDALGQMSSLTGLFLGDNQITTIPEVIGKLSNLKELGLPNNQIAEIPKAIRSMKNLEHLDLRGNPMPIPPQILGYGQDLEGCGDLRTILDFYFHTRNPVLPELDAERQKIEHEGYFDAETLQDARRRITASIVQRQGQAGFRRKLLIAYGGRCPITDCDVESAIEAAHIIPYQGTQTNHLTNGLPLRADIHTLFDLHLLSIRPDTKEIVIAPELVGTCYQDLADRKLTLPQDQKTAPNQNTLSKHYETFLTKYKSG
ncbi:leucine-rich repeat domain-containing protein [Microcoleus sp. B4-D4]|uniref:leucine-rich repeat domain-containing protein n=1 Tax=Microcoleus sp. B4-D4 TaxID=2818667 RepID=UPI002FD59EFD